VNLTQIFRTLTLYTPFSRWLDNPIDDKNRVLDTRDQAVLQFANSLLKRTLSETFVGVPLSDDGFYSLSSGSTGDAVSPTTATECREGGKSASHKRNKFIISARSLSLELSKHNHKLAAQLVGGSHRFSVFVVLCTHTRTHMKPGGLERTVVVTFVYIEGFLDLGFYSLASFIV
jgi:hypothetical protein